MENVPVSVQQTADELNGILSSFISRHPASLKYRTTEDGYSIFTIKYGKYRESEIKRVKEFVDSTDYDELLSIEGIPVTCIKVNSFIMVFKGRKEEVENFILNSNIENERLQEKISEKVKAVNYSEYNNNLRNLYNKINGKILWMINHYSQFNQSIIKDLGFSFNKINNDISQVSLNIEKFNSYRDMKLKNEIEEMSALIIDTPPTQFVDIKNPPDALAALPPLLNFSDIWVPTQEDTISVDYKEYMNDIYDIVSLIILLKSKYSKVENILKNVNYKTSHDEWFFDIIKSTDNQLIIEYDTKKFEEKVAFSIEDFNMRHLRWYELREWFFINRDGTRIERPDRYNEPVYDIFKLNPRFREDGIVLPDRLPEDFRGDILDYIKCNIFIPVEHGEEYDKNTIYLTPTRYGSIFYNTNVVELTYEEAIERFDNLEEICTFDEGISFENVVCEFDFVNVHKDNDPPYNKIYKNKKYFCFQPMCM